MHVQHMRKLKEWFDYKKIFNTKDEEIKFSNVCIRCLVLSILLLASLLSRWFCIPLLIVAIIFVTFENGINKLLYVIFLLPFYNVFRMSATELFWLSYVLAYAVLLLGIQILIKYIKKEEKIPFVTFFILAGLILYFVLPLRPTSVSTVIVVLANISFLAVFYLGKWKFELKYFVHIFTIGLIFASILGVFANHIPRICVFVAKFDAGMPGVFRLSGLDADPNYYSMNLILALSLYMVLYYTNRVTFKEFICSLFIFSVFGFMTISKTYYILFSIYLLMLAVLVIVKNRKNIKYLITKAIALLLVMFFSATLSISYINITLERISWTIAPLQKYDLFVYDIGDFVCQLYLNEVENDKQNNQVEQPNQEMVGDGANIEAEDVLQKPTPEQNFQTEISIPSASLLTTGRSDIWNVYFDTIKEGSFLEILFGTNAESRLISVNGIGNVASHNTIIQIIYYYGVIGLLILMTLITYLFIKNIRKYNVNLVNLLPAILYCMDLMALDNLTSLRSPIFIMLLSMSIFYACDRKNVNINKQDKVSIVVPIYNSSNTLGKCLSSIVSQTYKNLEIILINDGSKDDSQEICEKYAREDSRIIVHLKENKGVSNSRNKGIELATGEYICFIDSDDYIDQDYIEKLYMNIQNHDLVICGYKYVGTDLINIRKLKNKEMNKTEMLNSFGEYYLNDSINSPWNKMYVKNLITETFDESLSLGEDLLFNISYIENCNKIKVVSEFGYNYVKTGSISLTGRYNKEKFDVIIKIYRHCICKYVSTENRRAISTILIRNICGQLRKYFKSKQESKQEKLAYVAEYMERDEVKKSLGLAKPRGLKQRISFILLKNKKYELLHLLYKIY